MKTDKFEKTIRQKLESISPDFQESDWTKMQNYMQVHTPPTFWQQYGSWLGYAAAASVTTVMAFMYANQISQNNALRSDVKALQSQIAVISEKPVQIAKTDTVYIIRETIGSYSSPENQQIAGELENNIPVVETTEDLVSLEEKQSIIAGNGVNEGKVNSGVGERSSPASSGKDLLTNSVKGNNKRVFTTDVNGNSNAAGIGKNITPDLTRPDLTRPDLTRPEPTSPEIRDQNLISQAVISQNTTHFSGSQKSTAGLKGAKTLGSQFDELAVKEPVLSTVDNKMNIALTTRLSPKQVRKTWLANTAHAYKATAADKKVEQATQAENVIPKLKLKVPYRFGGGMEWQKYTQSKTVVGEVLVSKKFSISAGVSWLKIKQMEFFTEKMFRDKNNLDFKKAHPNEVPKAFVVTNIRVAPTLVQIPLTVAFRNELKDNWSYYVSTTANVTLKANENFSYNCLVPNPKNEFLSKSFNKKMDISPINSLNFSLGVEKTWHPIVIQADGFIYTYFKPLTPLARRTGPGFRVKLLYQIGKKM